ncbi:MAG: hypothetical protein K6C99_09050 [Lachnospiraceae bacterium]|nr:hypothetical protein [Lachnospiraceae bacterium]
MRKRMLMYLKYIDQILSYDLDVTTSFSDDGEFGERLVKDTVPTRKDYEKLLQYHLDHISFFQHERLIHLMVTILFAVLAFAVFFVMLFTMMTQEVWNIGLFVLFIALMILLIPYIRHYYFLENGVQKMYKQYDEILKRIRL